MFVSHIYIYMGFPDGSEVKASASNAGDLSSIPGSGRSLEKEMATHSSILAWRIPWTEEPDALQSMGSQRVGHDWATLLSTFMVNKNLNESFIKYMAAGENLVLTYRNFYIQTVLQRIELKIGHRVVIMWGEKPRVSKIRECLWNATNFQMLWDI